MKFLLLLTAYLVAWCALIEYCVPGIPGVG